ILTEYGNVPEVAEIDRPALPEDSVMIEVHAAAINPIDWIVMAGYMAEMIP
ncbi:MAG: NADP-dependent oxidoreductase, partial [Acidimicrobiia bacterium]|nr:NADP-dependent oxidoreductase [Acidimicrobiia bacterium]